MNLGQAVAVCLYELVRDARAARRQPEPRKPASADELERVTELLLEALSESGYLKQLTSASTIAKTRRLVRRLGLNAQDALVWQGMLRQMLWKMRSGA